MATVTKTLKDAAYVTVGLGVLGIQQAQVRRRELRHQVERGVAATRGQLGQLGERVPDQARDLLGQVTVVAREVPGQVRALVGR